MDPLTISIFVASVFVVSALVVFFDDEYRYCLDKLLVLIPPLLIAILLVLLAAYTYISDTPPFAHVFLGFVKWNESLYANNFGVAGLLAIPNFLVMLVLFILVLVSIAVTYVGAVIAVGYLAFTVLKSILTLLLVQAIAVRNVARGFFVVVTLPFFGIREGLFLLTQPRGVREIKRAVRQQSGAMHENLRRASDTIEKEATRAVETRWWKPSLSIFTSIRHYDLLADYISSLSRVQEEVNEHFKNAHRRDNGKRS